jgi:hypothetical protein
MYAKGVGKAKMLNRAINLMSKNTEMFKNDNTIMFDIKHLSIKEKRKEIQRFNPYIYVFGYELKSKPWLTYEEFYANSTTNN